MAVSDHVKSCVELLNQQQFDNAFVQLSQAIDVTAKKSCSGKKSAWRCRAFLKTHLPFALWCMQNTVASEQLSMVTYFSEQEIKLPEAEKWQDAVYSALRSGMRGEKNLKEKLDICSDTKISERNGKIRFPVTLLEALLFAVVIDPANNKERVEDHYRFYFSRQPVRLNALWGDKDALIAAVRNGCIADLEQQLKRVVDDLAVC